MPATATPLPPPDRTPDPVLQAGFAELFQLGLVVARVASRLAEAENRTLDALADAAAHATASVLAPHTSLREAIEAGRNADISDAACAAVAARVASITDTFDKAARAVRRTAALQARLAEGRPFRPRPFRPRPEPRSPEPRSPARTPTQAASTEHPAPRRPANDPDNDKERPERPDTPEWGDELGTDTDTEILRGIRRDLATAQRSREVIAPGNGTGSPIARMTEPRRTATLLPAAAPNAARPAPVPPTRPDPLPPPDN